LPLRRRQPPQGPWVEANCWGVSSPESHCGRFFWSHPAEGKLSYGVPADVAHSVLWTDREWVRNLVTLWAE
jgi:hypothetical protein